MAGSSLRPLARAGALTLLSGGVMMLAGYVAHARGWSAAGPITLVGGALILPALRTARRPGAGDTGWARRGVAMGATMLSGAVMVLAGYGAAAWSWMLAPALALAGGVVIGAAFLAAR